jgi:hypothetical protein
MRDYSERLGVPVSWWLVVTACVVLLGTTLWAGLTVTWAIVIYAGLEAVSALVLLAWGAARITVTQRELHAGSQRLPVASIASATVLDRAQTSALRGPRPYLPLAVYVALEGRPAERPYWLIGTRRPAELAAAIERAVGAARDGLAGQDGVGHGSPRPWDDAADEAGTRG